MPGRSNLIRCLALLLCFTACARSSDDDTVDVLALAGLQLGLRTLQSGTLTIDGSGQVGGLTSGIAVASYVLVPASEADHLLALYELTPVPTVASFDAILELRDAAGTLLFSEDRTKGGEFERRSLRLSATPYVAAVRGFRGSYGLFRLAATAGSVSGGGSCRIGTKECRDYVTTAGNFGALNCSAAGGTYDGTNACSATSRVGRCTTAFADAGITTVSGYSPGFLSALLFQANCTTVFGTGHFLFQ